MRWALAASQAQPQTQQNCPQTARYLRPCPGPGVLQRPESSLDLALSSAEQLLGEIVSAFPYSKNWGEKEEENRTWTHKPQSVEVPAGPGWYMPGGARSAEHHGEQDTQLQGGSGGAGCVRGWAFFR